MEHQTVETLNLNNLFSKKLVVELQRSSADLNFYTQQEIEKMPGTIYMHLQMHQVDDYFFRSQEKRLYQLALHFITRRQEELELYKDRQDIVEKITAWPDGTKDAPVMMSDLINERKICAGLGKELLQYILDFERMILNDYCQSKMNTMPVTHDLDIVKTKKQQVLESFAEQEKKELRNKKYISFPLLQKLGLENFPGDTFKAIKILRNQCQHSVIPLTGSFRKLSLPGSLVGDALHITQRLGKDRAAENIYEQDKENEVA
jgi:hypothetical protein